MESVATLRSRPGSISVHATHLKRWTCLATFLAVLGTELPFQCAHAQSFTLPVPSILHSTDTVRSPDGIFELGFKTDSQNNVTLAIWYADPIGTVVWVASRDVSWTSSAFLSVTTSGLVIFSDPSNGAGFVLSSSLTYQIAGANLQDDGNLVLLDQTSAMLWQSFDSPTDTLLPGQSYYLDNVSTSTELRSWRGPTKLDSVNSSDWNRGQYGLDWDSTNNLSLVWYSGLHPPCWYCGDSGLAYYSDSQSSASAYVDAAGKLFVVGAQNKTRVLLSSARVNPDGDPNSSAYLRRVTLDRDGGLRIYSWAVNQSSSWYVEADLMQNHCLVYGECGPNAYCTYTPPGGTEQTYLDSTIACHCPENFDAIHFDGPSQGCQRREKILASQCGDPLDLALEKLAGFDYPYVGDWKAPYYADLNTCLQDCLTSCVCDMVAYSVYLGWCWLKSGDVYNGYLFNQTAHDGDDRTAYFKVLANGVSVASGPSPSPNGGGVLEPPPERQSPSLVALIVGVCASGVVAALLGLCLFYYLSSSWKRRLQHSPDTNITPRVYAYKELSSMTKGFDDSELLSSGAFGEVYKGTTPSGALVAIKRIKHTTENGRASFVAEVASLRQIHHRNLLHLWGWCEAKQGLFLVYEFMCNGSLNKWLHPNPDPEQGIVFQGALLSWDVRHSILAGVASGLEYLHEECAQCVLHRDIKSSNVMLDADFNPYLGDFGLARLVAHHRMEKTTMLAGTLGYMAPEMFHTGRATKETDVYAYGVLVLEMVCGRKPLDMQSVNSGNFVLLDKVWSAHEAGNISEMADPRLVQSDQPQFDGSQELRDDAFRRRLKNITDIMRVGLSCCLPDPSERPSMRLVNQWFQSSEAEATEISFPCIPATKPAHPSQAQNISMRLEDTSSWQLSGSLSG